MTRTSEPTPKNEQVVGANVHDQLGRHAGLAAARRAARSNSQEFQQAVKLELLDHLQTPPRILPLTEDQFKPIAQYVVDKGTACRYGRGVDTKGAAYALTDITKKGESNALFGMDVLRWMRNPYNDIYDSWDDRLWNTCMVIVGLVQGQSEKKVALLNGCPAGLSGERYSAQVSGKSRGDGRSFQKVNITPAAQSMAEITISSTGGLVDQGRMLYEDIYTELGKLADPQPNPRFTTAGT